MAIPLLPGASPLWTAAPFILDYFCFSCPPYNPLFGPSKNTFSKSTSIVAYVSVAAGTSLPSRCTVTALHVAICSSSANRTNHFLGCFSITCLCFIATYTELQVQKEQKRWSVPPGGGGGGLDSFLDLQACAYKSRHFGIFRHKRSLKQFFYL
jgi:hypothetical protein